MKPVVKKNLVIYDRVRFKFISQYSFKAEYSPDGKFENRELFITSINSVLPVKIKCYTKNRILTIETGNLVVKYKPSKTGFNRQSLKLSYKFGDKWKPWYYGKKDSKNLGGTALHIFKFPIFVKPEDIGEGVLSLDGYYAYYDKSHTYWSRKKGWVDIDYNEGYETLFFTGYGRDFKRGLKEFSRIFGRPVLPPRWALGYWYSRWYKYKQDDFIDIVKKYRKFRIPIDVIVVDTDWRSGEWIGFDWAKKYFYNPAKFVRQMKKLGIKLTLNDHPGYGFSEPVKENDSHFKKLKKYLKEPLKKEWRCNWSREKDVNAFLDVLIKPKIKLGFDFWWIDGWGANGIYRNEDYFENHEKIDSMALGPSGREKINPQLWLNYFYSKASREVNNKRPLILSRWGGIGSHRYPLWFSGDTFSTWKTLEFQVWFTYTAGNVLTNYWSHDLGGFIGDKISKDLFIRWIQFGSLSPVMRTHSSHGLREPWAFDKETVEIFRKCVRLRYRLVPYFYTCAFESYFEGMPIVRAGYHNYPYDEKVYNYKQQYFIGDNFLIAPVVKSQGKSLCVNKKIYFPEGEWIRLENKQVIKGPKELTIKVPLSEIPVFIKKGSIIPVAQDQKYTDEKKNNILRFEVFPGGHSKFVYYEDDGVTEDYIKGKYVKIPVEVKLYDKLLYVNLGKMEGSYKGLIKKRKLQVILHFTEKIKLTNVSTGNKKLGFTKISKIFGEIESLYHSYKIETVYSGNPINLRVEINQ